MASPAFSADTPPADADKPAAVGEVVITGSRILRQDFTAISPVTTVGAADIELTSALSIEQVLNELPQIIPGNTVTSNNAGGEDFATVDLFGLGPNRTLVLLNGERVPAASTTGVVDVSGIPTGLLDRIEVVVGGASAVYGSDAMAGVVNFILKEDYEGAEVTSQYATSDGKGTSKNFGFLLGGNLANGKGNITTYGSYAVREGVSQSAYDYSKVSGALVYGYDSATSSYTGVQLVDSVAKYLAARTALAPATGFSGTFASGGSGTPPWAQIRNNAANPFTSLSTIPLLTANFTNQNTDCNPATAGKTVNTGNLSFNDSGQLTPSFTSGACAVPSRADGSSRYNFAPDNFIYLPAERISLQTLANYQLTDAVEMKLMLSYTDSRTQVQLAPTPSTPESVAALSAIPVTSPLIPADLAAALASRPNPTAPFAVAWRSNALGPRAGLFENSGLIGRANFTGKMKGSWNWSFTAGYGKENFNSELRNNVNAVALGQGLVGCANVPAAARLPNCVDVSIWGPNSITPAMASFLRTNVKTTGVIEQSSFSGFVRGDLFNLPAGPVSAVLGAEYRDDRGSFLVDDAQRRGAIAGFNAQQDVIGAIDVYELYGEVSVPLLKDLPFVHSASLEAGYRRSDYSTVGNVESYKIGLEYSPVSWLTARTVFNRAVRAPSLVENFQAGDQGFPAYTEPCRQSAVANNATLKAFCIAQGVPTSAYPGFAANNAQVQSLSFGNKNLQAEQAKTFTVGFVAKPDFLPIGKLRASVDYYDIQIDKPIISRGAQTILNSCYGNLGATPQSAVDCSNISRDPATGQINFVNTSLVNGLAQLATKGIGVQIDYGLDLEEVFKGVPGRLTIRSLASFVDSYDSLGTEIAGTTEAGIGGAIPDQKYSTYIDYKLGDWLFRLANQYIPGLKQDYPGGTFQGTHVPNTPEFNNFDVSVRWDATDKLRLSAIIEDITNKFPPQTVTGFFDQANTDAALYSPWALGRRVSVSARYRF